MAKHPFHDVAIVGVHNTTQGRMLEGHDAPDLDKLRAHLDEAGLARQ